MNYPTTRRTAVSARVLIGGILLASAAGCGGGGGNNDGGRGGNPTPSPTPLPTATLTPTPSPTPTGVGTPTPTPTPATSPTSATSPTPTPTVSPSPSPTPTVSPTPVPTPTRTPSPTPIPTGTPIIDPTPTPAGTASVDLSSDAQAIDGFGGASAWQGAYSTLELNELFGDSTLQQIGLSIDRMRIDPGGSAFWADERSNAQGATARGAITFATPWTPPISMKTNNNTIAGNLKTDQYAAFATYLNSFVTYMAAGGVSLYAISIQNEPDFNPGNYESCLWDATMVLNFMKNNAGSISTKVIMPESFHFDHALSDPTLNDATAAANTTIVGGHIYGSGLAAYPLAVSKGKHVWMTEHYIDGTDITSALTLAKEITDCMSIANMNAYVYWWMRDNNTGLITTSDQITRNGYALAQFAHFIRPGWTRENSTYHPAGSVYVTAYKGSGHSAIVAVNMGASAVNQPFAVSGGAPGSYTPYITSSSLSLAQQSAVAVSGGGFNYVLPAQSITTFYN